MSKIIIGLAGELAAGKGSVSDYLVEAHNASRFGYSDSLRAALAIFDLEISRENLQKFSTVLRGAFGENLLEKAILREVNNSKALICVIDGIRRMSDVTEFVKMDNFYLVAVTADPKIRYERIVLRKQNTGEDKLTFEDFMKQHEAETEKQIEEVISNAKFKIINDRDLSSLHMQIEEVLKQITK